jgi:hypothetical protein
VITVITSVAVMRSDWPAIAEAAALRSEVCAPRLDRMHTWHTPQVTSSDHDHIPDVVGGNASGGEFRSDFEEQSGPSGPAPLFHALSDSEDTDGVLTDASRTLRVRLGDVASVDVVPTRGFAGRGVAASRPPAAASVAAEREVYHSPGNWAS